MRMTAEDERGRDSYMGGDTFEVPTHKVGIKLLTDEQMINVLPSYRMLLERIENHRRQIKKLNGERLRHYQYNMMYDNVFSIFGKRGTGKTSIAFTLQKKFWENKEHPYDLVMPIIIPEIIPSDCSALGWLLEIVGEKISEVFGESKPQFSGKGNAPDPWDKCKYREEDGKRGLLRSKFAELTECYYSIKYDPSAESSYTLAVGNSARQAQNYYKLSRKITELWDCFAEAIREKYSRKDISPLIYFIFDDVDLAPEKVNELMSIIIKYLSHPNIIVITTADEETVLEVIEYRLDRNIGRTPKEWRHYLNSAGDTVKEIEADGEKKDLIGELARLYLGKVMPTSTRYYLRIFDGADEKWGFWINKKRQLGDALVKMVDQMLENIGVNRENFLKAKNAEMDFYLNFFGNTSRQISNTFLGVQEFLEESTGLIRYKKEKELTEQEQEILYESCRHFLQIALTANHSLAEILGNVDGFISEMFLLEHNNWKFYVGYKYLENFLKELLEKENPENVLRITLQLYSLFLFVENILVIIDCWTENRLTRRTRVHGITGMAQFLCKQVFQGKQKLRTDWSAGEFFRHYSKTLNRICYLFRLAGSPEKFDREYLYYFLDYAYDDEEIGEKALLTALERNKDWLRETAGTLFAVYGNMYLIGKREMDNCLIYRERCSLSQYQRTIESILQLDMRKCLSEFDVKGAAEREIQILNEIPDKFKTGRYSEKLRKEFRDKIDNGVTERLVEEYLGTHKEYNEGIKGNRELEQAFWKEFWEENDERHTQEYVKNSVFPLREVISKINEQCESNSLAELLKRLPKAMAESIADSLRRAHDRDGLLLSLNVMRNFLIQWDQRSHDIIFEDVDNFLELSENIGRNRDEFIELLNCAAHIREGFSGRGRERRQWSLDDRTIYTAIRESLKSISLLLESDESHIKNRIYISMDKLGKTFDVAVDVDDKNMFREAVIIGTVVQIMKRVQKLYLYQTVLEKYRSRDNNSSVRLEEARTRSRVEKGTEKENNSYYYAMFLSMKEILQRENKKDIEETDTLKNFIARAVRENRNQYLTKLINEVKHESDTD